MARMVCKQASIIFVIYLCTTRPERLDPLIASGLAKSVGRQPLKVRIFGCIKSSHLWVNCPQFVNLNPLLVYLPLACLPVILPYCPKDPFLFVLHVDRVPLLISARGPRRRHPSPSNPSELPTYLQ
ncbi:hypothetical protein F5Y17DRAFT_133589 [Xylariaceae sp. FL0594]|nr:hypothetical protein F5Y17DRAFT_133589 [Xylariaceae sp. FL0594]